MTDKGAEVHELGQVVLPATGQSNALPKTDSRVRGLKQDLRTSPLFFFGILVVSTWEAYSNTAIISLSNGGPRSSLIGVFVGGLGAWTIVRALAAMAAREPYVGAQYRWTLLYCPSGLQPRFWSHLQGWLTTWAWVVSAAVLPFYTAEQVLGVVTLFYPAYVVQGWHVYLVAVAFMVLPILGNMFARKVLKWIEFVGGACHFIAYVVITAVLWALAPRNTEAFVFSQPSEVPTGWKNEAVRTMLGMQATLLPLSAFDGILHMSDEVQNPRERVPRAMTWSYGVGWIFLFTFMFTFNFNIGDPEVISTAPPGWQLILMLQQATKNAGATTFIMVLFMLTSMGAYFNGLASVSRLVWAFSRDNGLPLSRFFTQVSPRYEVPLRAILLVASSTLILLLLPIFSSAAWNALLSLSTISLYVSYFMPILFAALHRRKTGWADKELVVTELVAVPWCIFVIGLLCVPPVLPANTPSSLPWSGPIMVMVGVVALIDWTVRGHREYAPVESHGESIAVLHRQA